jgi:S-adenosyl-L-methionine hydrolase (adenosine-forming)
MAIVTLTTDWNRSDYYIGSVKGKLLSLDPSLQIVDISHQVQAFNIMQAAFILRNCCFDFPKGTIHLVAVNASLSKKRALLLIEMQDHFFLSSDNGIVGLLFGEKPDKVYKIRSTKEVSNFVSLEIFIDTINHLLHGDRLESFSDPITEYEQQIPYRPVIDKNLINGSVIYVDSFSNAITNISKETFEKVGQGKPFEVFIQSNHYKIDSINQTYSDSVSGELLALFNSIGLLEVAINNGSAAELLNLTINSAIRVKFYDEKPGSKLTLTGG